MRALTKAEAGNYGITTTGNSDAPAVEITNKFTYQSYLSNSLAEKALLAQPTSEPIVPSTKQAQDISGWGVGLHPSSETPVAITFRAGDQKGSSSAYRLKPGQVIRPYGAPGGAPGRFSGFEWGLPFGWLGGGAATLLVFRTEDAQVDWMDHAEVVYHRIRLPIVAPANVPASISYNWPSRFPWPQAVFGADSLTQRGRPALSVHPTRTLMRLRLSNLAAPSRMRVYFVGADALDEGSNGVVGLIEPAGVDVAWGSWASIASANFATQYQTLMFTGELERLGANEGGIILVDASGGALAGSYVDIVRYGRL